MKLSTILRDELVAHCLAGQPNEACGLLAGPPGGIPTRHIPMRNATPSPVRYTVDPVEQLAIYAEMDARGEDPLVVYHSHPRGLPVPSLTDIEAARDPDAVYLIVSLGRSVPELAAWRIVGGDVREEPIEVV